MKAEEHAPSAEAKDDITRISDLFVKSTILDETFRLERLGIGIDFLVPSHAPVNAIRVTAYFEGTREPTIS
jgi:hypothetical protein